MSNDRFYGWETATVTDEQGRTVRDYYDMLCTLWCAETCAPRLREQWCPENKTLGQCSITAFLVQDHFGGKVLGIPRANGNYHCFNVVVDRVFDLTSEQSNSSVMRNFLMRIIRSNPGRYILRRKKSVCAMNI